jgi:hypothetical protein
LIQLPLKAASKPTCLSCHSFRNPNGTCYDKQRIYSPFIGKNSSGLDHARYAACLQVVFLPHEQLDQIGIAQGIVAKLWKVPHETSLPNRLKAPSKLRVIHAALLLRKVVIGSSFSA